MTEHTGQMTFTEFALALRRYGVTKVYLTEEGMQQLAEENKNMFNPNPVNEDCDGYMWGVQYFKDTK